ncbi:cation transporting ATPase C-terminal domain-containing protein [Atopococcus tabaci]|uniref:cation transporting ATPase C-terminal domain-containing protein n=1 Tax=Atopococcus tabaci TaxID=269774 RepID=UPI0024099E3E|nr:cation transporting ATPase C-terminal domain-containing protein [Atopococcus tabaci]
MASFIIKSASKQSIFKIGFMSNPVVFWTTLFSVVLTGFVAAVPFLADIFMLAELGATHWIITALMSLSIIATVEIDKNFIRGRDK